LVLEAFLKLASWCRLAQTKGGTLVKTRCSLLAVVMVLLTGVGGGLMPVALGATIAVPCLGSEGLIAALEKANADPEPSTIELAMNCRYILEKIHNEGREGDNGLPQILADRDITINGNGSVIERKNHVIPEQSENAPAAVLGVTMAAEDGSGETPLFRFFQVNEGARLVLKDLTLQNGLNWKSMKDEGGGAVANWGDLEVNNCALVNNVAGCGGGIHHETGTLKVTHTAFVYNSGER
jgi:hypothetical protein